MYSVAQKKARGAVGRSISKQYRIQQQALAFIERPSVIYSLEHGLCSFTAVPRSTQPSTVVDSKISAFEMMMMMMMMVINVKEVYLYSIYYQLLIGVQVRHVLTRDHTVLPATHTFIHKWNEPYLPLTPQPQSIAALLASTHFPSR